MIARVVRRIGYAAPVRRAITSSHGLGTVTSRFVGGPDESTAVAIAAGLHQAGLMTSLHVRQGNPRDEAAADEHVELYRRLVEAHAAAGLSDGAEISLKMVQFGLLAPGGLDAAVDRMATTVGHAAARGVQATVDMEGVEEVDDTLEAVRRLRTTYPDVGMALQANLRRTEGDCRDLAHPGSRVRLVKGAYGPGDDVGIARRSDVDAAYERCLGILVAGGAYPMVASHDPRMILAAQRLAEEHGLGQDGYEVQMLMGVRSAEQRRLAAAGERVRVYVPYGPDWYGWFVNRIVEKPSNVRLLMHALVEKG